MIRVQHDVLLSSLCRRLTIAHCSSVIQFCHSLLQCKSHDSAVRREVLLHQNGKYFFMQCFPFSLPSEKAMIFGMFPFPGLLRFVLLLRAIFRCKWAWSICGMTVTGDNRRTGRKTCHSATLPTTNPTWTHPDLNPVFCRERQATNRLSHGTAPCSQNLCL